MMHTNGSCPTNIPGPCQEKQCGRCCDPVKIPFRKGRNFSDLVVPYDGQGNPIWTSLGEIRSPEHTVDVKVEIYKCLYYDKKTKSCNAHDDRPDICRNTSCIDMESGLSLFDELTKTTFITMRK